MFHSDVTYNIYIAGVNSEDVVSGNEATMRARYHECDARSRKKVPSLWRYCLVF
jgi:hypothetical protein